MIDLVSQVAHPRWFVEAFAPRFRNQRVEFSDEAGTESPSFIGVEPQVTNGGQRL